MHRTRAMRPLMGDVTCNNPSDTVIDTVPVSCVSDEECDATDLSSGLYGRQPVLNCGICDERFPTKKQLRVHIHTHLRRPRIVLRRVTEPKVSRKHTGESYWLDPEKKGSLKLTLKKQSILLADSLKLTLKKSSESADFTVVSNNFDLDFGNYSEEDVAGAKENDSRDDKAAESSLDKSFENVMVDQQVGFSCSKNVLTVLGRLLLL